jgi:hypothetical protein
MIVAMSAQRLNIRPVHHPPDGSQRDRHRGFHQLEPSWLLLWLATGAACADAVVSTMCEQAIFNTVDTPVQVISSQGVEMRSKRPVSGLLTAHSSSSSPRHQTRSERLRSRNIVGEVLTPPALVSFLGDCADITCEEMS